MTNKSNLFCTPVPFVQVLPMVRLGPQNLPQSEIAGAQVFLTPDALRVTQQHPCIEGTEVLQVK